MIRSLLLSVCLSLFTAVSALSARGSNLLVVIEDEAERSKYSQFWSDLEGRGYDITYKTPKDTSLSLFIHGEPAYSHLLLLPPKSKGLGAALTPNTIVDFVNAGSNVLLALSGGDNSVPAAISSLLMELDIQLAPERNSVVVDHFNYDSKSAAESHDVILAAAYKSKRTDVQRFFDFEGVVAFPRAVGQVLGNTSPLLQSVIKADSTAYTHDPQDTESDTEPYATGSQISLVTVFQGLNSARLAVLGSAEALEDNWFKATVGAPGKTSAPASNQAFAAELTSWTFGERGVLQVESVAHYLNEGAQKGADAHDSTAIAALELNPGMYRVKNDVHYSISISSWNVDHWEPLTLPAGDQIQLECTMLSPYHRLNLPAIKTTANATVFGRDFKAPDQHGIFNLYVEYKRPFFSNIVEKRTVTLRHFAHDEFTRSYALSSAWPWISGLWVTIAGFLSFSAVWLYSAPAQPKKSLKAA